MAQNIYDDADFFSGYSGLRRSITGLGGMPEWPTMRAMVGTVTDKRVVDLGCGFGWFSRWAAAAGASSVVGIDLSDNMLARALADTEDTRISYERQDLETLVLPASFDIAYSALTLHYVEHLGELLRTLYEALSAGGRFVFSVEHPIYTAPSSPGFIADEAGNQVWPIDRYLDEGQRTTDWLTPGVIKQHRTIGTYLAELRSARFDLVDLIEWGPTAEQIDLAPNWRTERDRPPFLLVSADKR
jgi:SAM-dependent methyltransferase